MSLSYWYLIHLSLFLKDLWRYWFFCDPWGILATQAIWYHKPNNLWPWKFAPAKFGLKRYLSIFNISKAFFQGGDEINFNCWNTTQEIADWLHTNYGGRNEEEMMRMWNLFLEVCKWLSFRDIHQWNDFCHHNMSCIATEKWEIWKPF